MQFELSAQAVHQLDVLLATGKYASPSEAVSAALEQMLLKEQRLARTLAEIQESFADEKAGRIRTLAEVAEQIRTQHGFSTPR